MIWLILAIMTLGTLLYLCAPLYSAQPPEVVGEDIDAYRLEAAQSTDVEAVNFERQLLARIETKPVETHVPRLWLAAVFFGGLTLTAALYAGLGRPDLAAGRAAPPVMSQPSTDAEAIAQMSPQDRAQMISAMVEGLSARLKEDPEDVEGWVRLLRSRAVLGQADIAKEELVLMRATFSDRPDIIADILQRSGQRPQE